MMNKNIFVACDISSQKEVLNILQKIKDDIYGIKIGLQYITQRSPDDIKELSKFKKPIFLDKKFSVWKYLLLTLSYIYFFLSKINFKKKITFLFGPEASGLTNKEISFSNYVLQIPSNPKFRSLNLSHGLIIVAQKIFEILNNNKNNYSKY